MMEPLLETIDLDMEESNELAFKIKVEGTANSPAKVRLVCESSDVSYMFNGRGTSEEGVVQFILPQMKDKLQEGTYSARVEVLIENRYFSPVQFQINWKKALKVVAESIFVAPKAVKQDIAVTAQPITVTRQQPKQSPQPIVIEEQIVKPAQQEKPLRIVEPPKSNPPATQKSTNSLRDRYVQKVNPKIIEENVELNDEMIHNITKTLLSLKSKR